MYRPSKRLFTALLLAANVLLVACGSDNGVFRVSNTDFFAEGEFSIEVDADGLASLGLAGISGNIDVTGVSGAESVLITGTRRVESESVEDAERNLAELKVSHSVAGDGISVRTSQPEKTEGRNFIVNYSVSLPKSFITSVTNVSGNVTVESMQSTVTIANVSGSIRAPDIFGSVSISQANGPMDASVTLPVGGSIEMACVAGDIDLEIPQSTSATLSATVKVGSRSVSNLILTNEVQTSGSLTGTIGKGNGTVVLATSTGDIRIAGSDAGDSAAIFPLGSYMVIQEFANVNPAFDNRHHAAEDAYGIGGTPVHAIADGVISYSGPSLGYGWLITVDHPAHGVYSLYGHLSTRRSKIADGAVKMGDVIAYLADDDEDGSGGIYPDWGPHLHFGIRQGSRADYPSSDDDNRWMAGYTYVHPTTLGWLDPTDFIVAHSK